MCINFGASGGHLGVVLGHIMELEGPRGLFDTGKSNYMWRVATISLCLAVLNRFLGGFGGKRAVFGPKLQFLCSFLHTMLLFEQTCFQTENGGSHCKNCVEMPKWTGQSGT